MDCLSKNQEIRLLRTFKFKVKNIFKRDCKSAKTFKSYKCQIMRNLSSDQIMITIYVS